jgi:hypothetical protein
MSKRQPDRLLAFTVSPIRQSRRALALPSFVWHNTGADGHR